MYFEQLRKTFLEYNRYEGKTHTVFSWPPACFFSLFLQEDYSLPPPLIKGCGFFSCPPSDFPISGKLMCFCSQSSQKLMILSKIRPSCIIINVSFWSFSYVHLNPLFGSGIQDFFDPRIRYLEKTKSGINILDHTSAKNTYLCQFSVADLYPVYGMKKSRPGIRDIKSRFGSRIRNTLCTLYVY